MKNLNHKLLAKVFSFAIMVSVFFVSCKEEFDHTVDVENPTVVSFNPVLGVGEISVNSNLVVTFSERVKKGKGNILLQGESSSVTLDVSTDAVAISEDGRIMTVMPGELNSDEQYTVTLDRGVVTDLLGNEFMGTDTAKPWTFTTAGDVGPLVVSTFPENGGTDGSLFKLEMNFLAEVMKGEGNISIFSETDGKLADISVLGSGVKIDGKKVIVSLPAPLEFASSYYVTVDDGAIVDLNRKRFKGFSDNTSWKFTTTAGSGSDLIVHLPMDNSLADESGNRFDATLGSTASAQVEFVNDEVRGKVASFVAGSFAVLPKHQLLRPSNTESFSFNLWVKLKGIGSDPVLFSNSSWDSGGNPGFVLCTDGGATYTGPGSSGRGWLLKVTGGQRMDWRASEMTPQAPALADEQWHMVTVVFNQDTKILHVYIDGKEFSREGHAASRDLNMLTAPIWDQTNDYPMTIWEDGTGVYNAGSDTRKALAGLMDELRIYGKALTPAEIANLYTK